MGFHTGAHATVWEIQPQTDSRTIVRISISRKNKTTEQLEQDFSGFVAFVGTANASKAAKLKERDWIILGDTDVQRIFNKEQGREYIYYTCFGFEVQDKTRKGNYSSEPRSNEPADSEPQDRKTPF